jgi:hypothetical protein
VSRPTDSEHALIGTLAFRSGDDCVVVFVWESEFCPGSIVLPISLASAVIGTDIEMGSPLNDGVGASAGVDTFGVETGAGAPGAAAGAGVGAGAGAGAGVLAGSVILGNVTVVDVVPAPAGPLPANTVAAARTRPPVATAADRSLRLTVLLPLCMGYTDTRSEPATLAAMPNVRNE